MYVLHHQEWSVVFTQVVQLRDVRVMQARCDLRLLDEHTSQCWIGGQLSMQRLDGDELAESARPLRPCGVHRADTAGCNLGQQPIASQLWKVRWQRPPGDLVT